MSWPYVNQYLNLLIAAVVFLLGCGRRKAYWLALPLFAVCGSLACACLGYIPIPTDGWWVYIIPCAVCAAFVFACYRLSPLHAVFFALIAYSIQNCTFNVSYMLTYRFGRMAEWATALIQFAVLAAILAACWFLFIRGRRVQDVFEVHNLKLAILGGLILVLVYVLNSFVKDIQTASDVVARILLIVCVFLSLFLIFGMSARERLTREKREIEQMLKREETLHRIAKENIDIINIKCHDLKHRLALCGHGQGLSEEELREMQDAVAVYDGFVSTGNADLDIVIAEKSMRCRKGGIALSCMADGARLSFLSPGDIYSLFGNALDNAIEYLERVEDAEKRVITCNVQARGGFVAVGVENYCGEKLAFADGLPVTSKSDKDFHGFGVKSIRYIVEKYGGTLCIEQKGDTFAVNILFPEQQPN